MTTKQPMSSSTQGKVNPLHMIRADLDIRAFNRWAGRRGLISRSTFDEGFAMHCLLVESFGELAPKPFRIIIPRSRHRRFGTLYGYGQCSADTLRDAAATYCDPLQARILPSLSIDSKVMPTAWRAGQRLGFEALLRPVRRLSRCAEVGGERHRILERDAFLAQAVLYPKDGMPHSREEVYADWLKERLEADGAAKLEYAKLAMFQRVRTVRKLRARPSEGPQALMRGVITVSDPEKFDRILAHGVGRHKAYGYGMLLLRPALTQR